MLAKYISVTVAVMQIGIAAVMIREDFISQRNKKRTIKDNMPP
jgi:hypothetical protein